MGIENGTLRDSPCGGSVATGAADPQRDHAVSVSRVQDGSARSAGVEADSVSQLLHHVDEVRGTRREDCVRLLRDVEGIRRRRQRDSIRLLRELTPHLRAARTVEHELDRHLARRFNAFRYLRDDEHGLSRIIADLLDPAGEHGQGATFLTAMMELLGGRVQYTTTEKGRVVRERGIPGSRRIDITVDVPTVDGFFCLAIENKPYADDQPGQCRAYLKFLSRSYDERFLLVYLPPRYRMPSKSSLPPVNRECWKDHFRVLPYVADDAALGDDDPSDGDGTGLALADSDEDDAPAEDDATAAHDDAVVGDGASLAGWLGTCCKLVRDAERLRWFLREAQLYCQHHFGGSTMTDIEARYIREYLAENPRHLPAAFAVARAWPAFKHEMCRRFLEHVTDRVEERIRNEFPEIVGDLDVECRYGGDKKYSNYLRVYRYGWVEYEGGSDRSDGRTAVMLECGTGGPTSWHWGVRSAKVKDQLTTSERERREELEDLLKRNGLSLPDGWQWPHIESPRHRDWSAIVPELVQELTDGGGKITDHYVNGLLGIAAKAIPAIDEVELGKNDDSSAKDS